MKYLMLIFSLVFFVSSFAFADWVGDYEGKLGDQDIGFAIIQNTPWGNDEQYKIVSAYYFYKKDLKDIPLKLKEHNGRNFAFEEYDAQGNLVATFQLTFTEDNPKSNKGFAVDIVKGEKVDADGNKLQIYLDLERGVSSDAEGGRCGLTLQQYKKVEEKVKKFHLAVTNKDSATLLQEFDYKVPESQEWLKAFSLTIPHALFCNYQGFMLGHGIVWFDFKGNPITK